MSPRTGPLPHRPRASQRSQPQRGALSWAPSWAPGAGPPPRTPPRSPPQAPEASPAQGQTQRSPETQSLGCRARAGGFPSGRRSGRVNPAGLRRDRTADRTGAGLPPALRSQLCLPQRRHLEPWLGPFGSGLRGCTVRTEARHRLRPSPARPLSPLRPRRPTRPGPPELRVAARDPPARASSEAGASSVRPHCPAPENHGA